MIFTLGAEGSHHLTPMSLGQLFWLSVPQSRAPSVDSCWRLGWPLGSEGSGSQAEGKTAPWNAGQAFPRDLVFTLAPVPHCTLGSWDPVLTAKLKPHPLPASAVPGHHALSAHRGLDFQEVTNTKQVFPSYLLFNRFRIEV